jgi:hypothetical protein
MYEPEFDVYGLIVHDGGHSTIQIDFCPWCGARFPDSKRDRWFDEVTILDPLFAARVPRSALSAENYSEWFNVPSHGLASGEVDEILQSLVSRKLVALDPSAHWYGLTPAGGALWEARRNPDWSSYCEALTSSGAGDLSDLQITAVRKEVGQDFLELAVECGIYGDVVPAEVTWSPCESPIYWKRDLSAWTTHCQVHEDDSLRAQTSRFVSEKRWWSELSDLNRSR